MSYLSLTNNNYIKPKTNSFMLSDSPSRNLFSNDKSALEANENNNHQQLPSSNVSSKSVNQIWKQNFKSNAIDKLHDLDYNHIKMSWANERSDEVIDKAEKTDEENEDEAIEAEICTANNNNDVDQNGAIDAVSPSHHARRPMNAFLIFCKKHRPIVRARFQNLENRGVTRILGEWWAILDFEDKQPYRDLANEYKDAFLSANPDFKWYKLPAPPLRTLSTRPPVVPNASNTTIQKVSVPQSSPSPSNNLMIPEFTPGKLADESQLGGLTSLMNNDFASKPKKELNENNNNNNNHNFDPIHTTPVSLIKSTDLPPKPMKKRIFEQYHMDNTAARRLLDDEDESDEDEDPNLDENMTNQELMNKVVENIFLKSDSDDCKERKSDRQCKGKRYEQFMVEGKLLGNKKEKLTQQKYYGKMIDSKLENEFNKLENQTPKLDDTIKRLAERTTIKVVPDNNVIKIDDGFAFNNNNITKNSNERVRTVSENSDSSSTSKTSPTSSFNLDLRIKNLPCLSYEIYEKRKKDSKKRKFRTSKTVGETKVKKQKLTEMQLVGSKKRKNKQSITHLNNPAVNNNDLLGLATLAEVAANTEKINEKISE